MTDHATDRSSPRIASMLASGTEIVCGLGLDSQLVAISHECDYPVGVLDRPRVTFAHIDDSADSATIDAQVRERLTAGKPLYEIDVGKLSALRPDIIVTQAHCDVCAVGVDDVDRARCTSPILQDAKIVALNPCTLQDVFADIRKVARAVNEPDHGESYCRDLQSRVVALREVTERLRVDQRPRTLCIEWVEPLMVAANWMPELVEVAGGSCPLTRAGDRSCVTEWQDVCDFDPEVIVVMPCGFDLARSINEVTLLRERPGWSQLSAVRAGRVFALDGNAYFNRSGPRLVDSAEILAGLLHPEPFSAVRDRYRGSWRQVSA